MANEVTKEAQQRMSKSLEALQQELTKMRTGRANTSLLEQIKVSYYGNETPLNQVANIAVEGPRVLTVTPWEKNMVQAVEKAIMESELGLNPATAGTTIRVPLPQLTEERRKDLIRVIRDEGEKAKVAVRNIRRDANTSVKEMLKDKAITEDDERRLEAEIQKITDSTIKDIDQAIEKKEHDLMEI